MSEPSAELRAAAQRLRTLAEAATPGPWAIWRDLDHQGFYAVGDRAGVLNEGETAEQCNTVAHIYVEEDATFIAAMHPGVALALAKVLEREARQEEYRLAEFGHRTIYDDVLALARLVLEAK
jgi:hypothetical protein